MVGKPNFPPDVDERDDLAGSATSATPGLTALDQEREASLADEGGASGMAMESQEKLACEVADAEDCRHLAEARSTFLALMGAAAVSGFVLGMAVRR